MNNILLNVTSNNAVADFQISNIPWWAWVIACAVIAGIIVAIAAGVSKSKKKRRGNATAKENATTETKVTTANVSTTDRIAEPVKTVVEADKEEPVDEQAADNVEEDGTEQNESTVKFTDEFGIVIRYNKSFTARLIQATDEVKNNYSALKNELLSYKKAKSRVSWNYDSLNVGRAKIAKFSIRGKTLKLYLALNPDDYADTKYKVIRSESKRYEDVPCMYKITNPRRLAYAAELIAAAMEKHGIVKGSNPNEDFYLTYETTEALIDKALIKEISAKVARDEATRINNQAHVNKIQRESVAAAEVNALIADDVAVSLVAVGDKHAHEGKKGIINIDVLSAKFKANDTVTIETLKAKNLVDKNVGYVKVLARGVLDKPLKVELQDYSIEAIKMIILTGGKVKRK